VALWLGRPGALVALPDPDQGSGCRVAACRRGLPAPWWPGRGCDR